MNHSTLRLRRAPERVSVTWLVARGSSMVPRAPSPRQNVTAPAAVARSDER